MATSAGSAGKSSIQLPPVRPDGLQLEEKRDLQRRFWTIQRIGWVGFGLVVGLALLGLTGSGGPLQKHLLEFADAKVEMPRISRWEGADDMTVTFLSGSEAHEFTLDQSFMDRFAIERIQPEPESSILVAGGQRFRFEAAGQPPHEVKIDMRAMHFGWTPLELSIGEERKSTSVLVLP